MTAPVLITGGSSLLALNWAMARRARQPVTLGLHHRIVAPAGVQTIEAPIDTVDDVLRALDTARPGLVVHAAGLTNVEGCEADPDLARRVNVDLAVNVATACARRGVPLVHVSTDHLFRGDEALIEEDHPVDPQNVYGRTKADAERRVLETLPSALVVRTNFYGWGPGYRRSFSDRVIDALRGGRTIGLFEDVFYTPILASVLSDAVHDLVGRSAAGVVHVVGDERVSKYEFGQRIAHRFGLDPSRIEAGSLVRERHLAPRPLDMSLSNRRACALLGRPLGGVDAHLDELRDQEMRSVAGELRRL